MVTRRGFTNEFKNNAVDFVLDEGKSIAEVARSIDVNAGTLGNWVKKAKEERGDDRKPLNDNEREELIKLREENRKLRMEVEFSKKVAAWFANDPQ